MAYRYSSQIYKPLNFTQKQLKRSSASFEADARVKVNEFCRVVYISYFSYKILSAKL